MNKMGVLDWLAFALVAVGGLNWGLVGAFDANVVSQIFGGVPSVEKVVYVLVGVAALYMVAGALKQVRR
ncbi:MAG: DUF378 domain-containing protein [Candidatus Colwellbacteria bacterium]|nr:DUF378 domain-containing protein [Candidatus Colwellbacteria bacterium]